MRSTFETSRIPSSAAADANPPEPRACRLRSVHQLLKFACLEASGILIIIDARRPVPQFEGHDKTLPYLSEISNFLPTFTHAASTALTSAPNLSNTALIFAPFC